jgi:hypothetical protein
VLSRRRRRCGVNRARACLRRDHAALRNQRLLRHRLGRWRRGNCGLRARRYWLSLRGRWRRLGRHRNGCRQGRLCRRWRHHHGGRRCWLLCCRRSRRRSNNGRRLARRRNYNRSFCHCGLGHHGLFCHRRRGNWRRGRLRLGRRNGGRRLGHGRRRLGRRRWMLHCLLAFFQQLQHVTRLVRLGKVDLRLGVRRGGSFPGGRTALGREILPDLYRFILFNGARVRFLFRNAYFLQCVQNRFALYLKLSGQIIDSNLHALCFLQVFPATRSYRPHGFEYCFLNKLYLSSPDSASPAGAPSPGLASGACGCSSPWTCTSA